MSHHGRPLNDNKFTLACHQGGTGDSRSCWPWSQQSCPDKEKTEAVRATVSVAWVGRIVGRVTMHTGGFVSVSYFSNFVFYAEKTYTKLAGLRGEWNAKQLLCCRQANLRWPLQSNCSVAKCITEWLHEAAVRCEAGRWQISLSASSIKCGNTWNHSLKLAGTAHWLTGNQSAAFHCGAFILVDERISVCAANSNRIQVTLCKINYYKAKHYMFFMLFSHIRNTSVTNLTTKSCEINQHVVS